MDRINILIDYEGKNKCALVPHISLGDIPKYIGLKTNFAQHSFWGVKFSWNKLSTADPFFDGKI